jgi:hypothetical protein
MAMIRLVVSLDPGQLDRSSLIRAARDGEQRKRVNLRDRYHETLADYHRGRATQERAVGGSLHGCPDAGKRPPPVLPQP